MACQAMVRGSTRAVDVEVVVSLSSFFPYP